MQFVLTDIGVVVAALLGFRTAEMLTDYVRSRVVLGHGARRREATRHRQPR